MARKCCGATRGPLVCDRGPGHTGDHRGYLEAVDEVLFWPAAGAPLDAGDVAAAAEADTIRRVADHWFTQGGAAEFGPLEHDGREPRNADELIAAILDAVRSARPSRA